MRINKKTRIVTDGKRFWIQRRIMFIWTTLAGSHQTREQAESIARNVWGHEDGVKPA